MENSDQYVGLNFLFLIGGIAFVGYLLRALFFRHDTPERRMVGFAVVFMAAVVGMVLVNNAVF